MIKAIELKNTPYRKINTIRIDIQKKVSKDGSILLNSAIELQPHPFRMTERLMHWAEIAPNRVFIGSKDHNNEWRTLSYAETFAKVKSIAQGLLNKNISEDRPIVILSENSIEHGLMALAALHVGIPYSPVTPAYSLRSTDLNKLRHTIDLLTPGLIFVSDGKKYENALRTITKGIEVVVACNPPAGMKVTLLEDLVSTIPTAAVDKAFHEIQPETIAKILFTSGSTGLPKGVINTHSNICTNSQQITQTFPFLADEGIEFIDWLPWNHTFGGNHNFGLTVYNGGSFYIDEGNPTPAGIVTTVNNLRDRFPTVYFNVPKGFEELIPYLKREKKLREHFFSKLKMLFYAGAGMPQHVWDTLEELAYETTGERILIATGLGCTESSPSALFSSEEGGFAGMIGVPVPGLELKLTPKGSKLEARFRAPNITPGYWRNADATTKAFDEEGFFCTGDALKFVNPDDPNAGMIFDGRIAEDFKLNTGTWVSVGVVRSKLIVAGNGFIQDVVITGQDRDYIGAIIFPDFERCRKISGLNKETSQHNIINHPAVLEALRKALNDFAQKSTGSASYVKRAIIAPFTLSVETGEITDKGSINQTLVESNHMDVVEKIYTDPLEKNVIELNETNRLF